MTATTEPTRAPSKALYLTDYARSTWDIWALSVTLPVLARAPRGDGHAVLVIPGLGASDVSTLILRRFLEIYASHFGIGNHPAALWVIARPIDPGARQVGALPAPGPVALRVPHSDRDRPGGPIMAELPANWPTRAGTCAPKLIAMARGALRPVLPAEHLVLAGERCSAVPGQDLAEADQFAVDRWVEPIGQD